jgi:hypothetical protein
LITLLPDLAVGCQNIIWISFVSVISISLALLKRNGRPVVRTYNEVQSLSETREKCHWDLKQVYGKYRDLFALSSFRMEMKDKIQSTKNLQN